MQKIPPSNIRRDFLIILKATGAEAVRTVVAVHVGVIAVEVQVAAVDAINRTVNKSGTNREHTTIN